MRAFFRRIFTRKILVRLAFVFAALLTLIVLFYSVEKWRGQRAWRKYAAAAEQRGTKLWLTDFTRSEIPAAENYAALPCIDEIFRAVKEGREPAPGLPSQGGDNHKRPNLGNDLPTPKVPLAEWRDFFVATKEIAAPGPDPAKDLLAMLAERAPALQQLRDATPRHDCHFPTDWTKGVYTAIPHVPFFQSCARYFRISASARLATGDVSGAASEVRHLFRLDEALRPEPGILVSLVCASILDQALSTVAEGLASGQWSDAELVDFERRLAAMNPLANFRWSLGSERGFLNSEFDRIANNMSTNSDGFLNLGDLAISRAGLALYPSGWVRQNMVAGNEYYDFLLKPFELVDGREPEIVPARPSGDEWIRAHFGKSSLARVYYAFASSLLPITDSWENACLLAHARIGQARLSCALERHRRAHHALPEKLDALVPYYLPAIPKDIMAAQPMRYRPEQTGAYTLWSIGPDRVDGNGQSDPKLQRRNQLDWVWHISAPAK